LKFLQTTASHALMFSLQCFSEPQAIGWRRRSSPMRTANCVPKRSPGERHRRVSHLRGTLLFGMCGATEHLNGTGRTTGRARQRGAPGGLTNEGTTRVVIFDLCYVAFLCDARDTTQQH
jgi:hypothetical protein